MFIHVSARPCPSEHACVSLSVTMEAVSSTPVGQFFYPVLAHPEPGGRYCLLCADSVGGSQWAAYGAVRAVALRARETGTERRARLGLKGCRWRRASLLSEVRRPHREDSSAEGDSCV